MIAAWLCWLVPIAGALLVPLLAKVHRKLAGYAAVSMCLLSALATATLLPGATLRDSVGARCDAAERPRANWPLRSRHVPASSVHAHQRICYALASPLANTVNRPAL